MFLNFLYAALSTTLLIYNSATCKHCSSIYPKAISQIETLK